MARDATRRAGRQSSSAGPRRAVAEPGRRAGAGRAAAPSAAATAAVRAALSEHLAPALADAGLDLEDLVISRAGSRSVLRVVVDQDDGVDLDTVAEVSRMVSDLLDRVGDEAGLTGAYTLEVTSPGVGRPLTLPRHWRRAQGRLVEARRTDGTVLVGRVLGADEEGVDLAVPTGPARRGRPPRSRIERLLFRDVSRAVVQVEFGRPEPGDGDDEAVGAPGGQAGSAGRAGPGARPGAGLDGADRVQAARLGGAGLDGAEPDEDDLDDGEDDEGFWDEDLGDDDFGDPDEEMDR